MPTFSPGKEPNISVSEMMCYGAHQKILNSRLDCSLLSHSSGLSVSVLIVVCNSSLMCTELL